MRKLISGLVSLGVLVFSVTGLSAVKASAMTVTCDSAGMEFQGLADFDCYFLDRCEVAVTCFHFQAIKHEKFAVVMSYAPAKKLVDRTILKLLSNVEMTVGSNSEVTQLLADGQSIDVLLPSPIFACKVSDGFTCNANCGGYVDGSLRYYRVASFHCSLGQAFSILTERCGDDNLFTGIQDGPGHAVELASPRTACNQGN